MILKLVLLIYSIHYCKSFKLNKNLALTPKLTPTTTSNTRKEISMDLIEKWLAKPLLNVKHLHLELRFNNYQEDVENSYTQWFLKQLIVPITINKYELIRNKTFLNNFSRNNYVIVTSMRDLRYSARQFGNRAGVFFFIVNGYIDLMEIRRIFAFGWKHLHIFKNFLLTDKGVLIYDPFELNELGNYGKIIKYTGEETMERTLFYNIRGYPLRVQLFRSVYSEPILDPITKKVKYVYGVDGRVANLLQEHMNFTMHLQDPDPNYFGERSPNGTYNGVIGSILRGELDLCVTGFFIKDYMVPEMDFSVAVYDDKLCIYTPKAKKIPESILLFFAVRYDLWLGFILMAFFCSFFWALLRILNLHFNKIQVREVRLHNNSFKWQYARIFIDTWVVWVRVNITQYPPFHSERVFIASLCLISVIFGAIFESSLATVYIHPIYYNDIHTLQELDESGLYVLYKYSSMGDDLFFSETSPLFASLNKKLRLLNDLNADVIEDVAFNGGKAGVTRYTTLMMQSLHFIVSKQIWIVPECPKYYTISYVWPKDAPWDETINRLLLRIQNAGLINKFIAEMQTDVDIKIMKDRLYETQQGFKVLTIEDLQLAFYVVLTGSSVALLSLLIERKLASNKI
ncbi:ionotropic receptor 10a [Cochliomyia hominivorax]